VVVYLRKYDEDTAVDVVELQTYDPAVDADPHHLQPKESAVVVRVYALVHLRLVWSDYVDIAEVVECGGETEKVKGGG